MRRVFALSLKAALGVCLCAAGAWAAPQGEVRHVAVKSLPVKRAPFALSTTVAPLRYGTVVTLVDDSQPAAGQNEGKKGKKNKKQENRPPKATGPWVKVITGNIEGYVPAASLLTPEMFNAQSPEGAATEADAEAGKGFSESEDPEVMAAKGALGAMSGSGSDTGTLDDLIKRQPVGDVTERNREFRREGKLGEFKPAEEVRQ